MENLFSRVIVIAPTRSTCVNVHTVLSNAHIPPTFLMKERGEELADAVAHLSEGGFGIVAGTGTGKTVAIRDVCRQVLCTELTVDVVTREHETTEKTWRSNVLVVTPGVAVNWLKTQRIDRSDLIVIDEIHQTSEHLELAMAFAKRSGCTFVWMSATIDPRPYQEYLGARSVIRCEAFDPSRKAEVTVRDRNVFQFVHSYLGDVCSNNRGVAVFVPTRAMAEELTREVSGKGIHVDFYHGGEQAEKLRPFLTGEIQRPFMIFMTIAGASSLNIVGLDTVMIVDQMYTQLIRSGGVKTLEQVPLGSNELLQMGGRVNGRAENGKIYIFSDREVDFHSLRPTAPRFLLGGDLERVALTCAKLEIDARDLDLIGSIDHGAYARILDRFAQRGLIVQNGEIHLTPLGERVEALPVEPHWGEILVAVEDQGDQHMFTLASVVACIGQLYDLTRRSWDKWCGVVVRGSDHLTAYNIVATALREFGYLRESNGGQKEYALRGDWVRGRGDNRTLGNFRSWCDEFGFSGKAIKNVLLALRSVYRQLGLPLPSPKDFPLVTEDSYEHRAFVDLLAQVQSLDFVQGGYNTVAGTVFSSQDGIASANRTLGTVRYWTDKKGYRRASMEGTEMPLEALQWYAHKKQGRILGMTPDGNAVRVSYSATFAGEPIDDLEVEHVPGEVPDSLQDQLPQLFAKWLVEQTPYYEILRPNTDQVGRAKVLNVRAGSEVFETDLAAHYLEVLGGCRSVNEMHSLPPCQVRALYLPPLDEELVEMVLSENPDSIMLLGEELPVEYRAADYYGKAQSPCVQLSGNLVKANRWIELPDEGVKLPSGRVVEVEIRIADFYVKTFSDTDIPRLKTKVREYLNQKQWDGWSWDSRPTIEVPTPKAEDPMIPFETVVYGQCVVTGEDLVAYGTTAVKSYRYYTSDPHFEVRWFRSLAEAQNIADAAAKKLVELKVQAKADRMRDEVRAEAEQYRDTLRGLSYRDGWGNLPFDLRDRVRDREYYSLPSSLEQLRAWVEEAKALIAEVETALADVLRKREEKARSSSSVSKKGRGGFDLGALQDAMNNRL